MQNAHCSFELPTTDAEQPWGIHPRLQFCAYFLAVRIACDLGRLQREWR
ncbi:MAG: hypothetical protein KBG15_24365 [Kofleriaceae bacterium]|nr:hypothetical protein [Kofleriaceae bacterium]